MESDAYFGGRCEVSFSNPGISYVSHQVVWTMTDYPTSRVFAVSNTGESSVAVTIPSDWASNITNSTSAKCTVTVETFYGYTSLGSNSYSITLNIPNTAVPTITNVSISVYNDKTLDTIATTKGIFIQGVTGVRLLVSASADSGATISSYRFASSVSGFTQSDNQYYSNVQNTSGNISFTITVTDSRGKTATTTKTITVHAYNKPTITNASAFRCLEDGTPSENGTYATIKATANMTSVYDDNGKQFNSVTLKSTYFRATTGTPSQTTAVDNMENGKEYKNIGGSFSSLYQYYIRFTATDAISGATYIDVNISSAAFAIHIHNGGSGVAFGKTSEESHTVQVTENWTPKWGTYTMPGIVYGSYVSDPPASQVGIIWLKPKS